MKNKVLVKLIVPELDFNFDAFIYVNEILWKAKKMIAKSIYDLTGGSIDIKKDFLLINKSNGRIYDNNEIIIDTDIRNSTELVMILLKQ